MIIEYSNKYEEDVKELLVQLQEYIVEIDKEGYNIITDKYREEYFRKTISEIEKYNGKMFLYAENDRIIGLIVGIINNEEIDNYDFKAPKRGRITELVIDKDYRSNRCGQKLLNAMELYLKSLGCKDILIDVFAYNIGATKFYEKNGYHTRMLEVTKTNI